MRDRPTTPAIDTVVFDLGGVVIDWNPRHLYEKVIDDPAELDHFLTVVCPFSWHAPHDGGAPFAETIPARQSEFPDHAELIGLWEARYPEMVAGEIPGTAAVIDQLEQVGLRLLGLTNMPAEVWPGLRAAWPVVDRFEGVLVSGYERMMKPDPAIFALLLERYDLDPARTVFVDDSPPNVEGARRCGLHALHFTSAARLREDLTALGVL